MKSVTWKGEVSTSSITVGVDRDSQRQTLGNEKGSYNSLTFEYAGGPHGR